MSDEEIFDDPFKIPLYKLTLEQRLDYDRLTEIAEDVYNRATEAETYVNPAAFKRGVIFDAQKNFYKLLTVGVSSKEGQNQ